MKKLILSMLVLAMTSLAHAAIIVDFGGMTEVRPGEVVTLTIGNDELSAGGTIGLTLNVSQAQDGNAEILGSWMLPPEFAAIITDDGTGGVNFEFEDGTIGINIMGYWLQAEFTVPITAALDSTVDLTWSGIILGETPPDASLLVVPAKELTFYVDDDAPEGGDGLSWATAFKYLQDALSIAFLGDEIRVAQGIYKPDQGAGITPGNREATFQLIKSVVIKGGYAGYGEPDPNLRNINTYQSILSGDLNGDDIGVNDPCDLLNEPSRAENSYNVVSAISINVSAILDGFTITGGNANGASSPFNRGGGMYNDSNSCPNVANCTFSGNSSGFGGGMYNDSNSCPGVTSCTFSGNYASHGGGMCNINQASPTIIDSTFSGNSAADSGGGMYNYTNSSPTLSNCTFNTNSAYSGGGMCNYNYGSPVLTHCSFGGNSATYGGGAYNRYFSFPTLTNCVFSGNSADDAGGAVYIWDGCILTLNNCTLAQNSALNGTALAYDDPHGFCTPSTLQVINCIFWDGGNEIWNNDDSTIAIIYSDVQGGWEGTGNFNSDPMFVDPYNPVRDERDYHLLLNSPCINTGCCDSNDPNCDYTGQTDMDGQPRVMAGCVDIGADEFHPGIYNAELDAYYFTIQNAINEAQNGETIIVEDGTYTGEGNRDINFLGKIITLRSRNGPNNCVIDCEHLGSGFIFNYGEDANSVLEGFTIIKGLSIDSGGGILCESSSPTIGNCIIRNNSPDGIWIDDMSNPWIAGTVKIISNNLKGSGTLQIPSDATLEIHDSGISCNAAGFGTVLVPVGKELVIENDAVIVLGVDPNTDGTIQCNGMLRVKDNAQVSDTNINTVFASFEGSAVISNNIITTRAGTAYGQMAVKNSAVIVENIFNANGDRYIDVDPSAFTGVIEDNQIFVTVTEGRNNTPPGLFELRGRDMFCPEPPCPCEPNLYPLDPIPGFDVNTWTIERLELLEGAKVNLTNRFDFQPPYDSGGEYEVLYVKHLILGPNSVLNIGLNHLYYEELDGDPNTVVKDIPPMGFLLDEITVDSEEEFETYVTHNNVYEEYPMIFVERVEEPELDPNGVIRMSTQIVLDPCSPSYLDVENARAKFLLAKSSEDEILVRFKYLFETPDSNAGLDVYLSDVPDLLAHDDPNWMEHYIQIAYVPAPPPNLPGSAGSDRFGIFQMIVSPEHLNFIEGMWLELELIEPAGSQPPEAAQAGLEISNGDTAVLIDDVGVEAHCSGYCMDFNWSMTATESDFLIVIAFSGLPASLDPNATESLVCLDGFFSIDGYVDPLDIISWDWAFTSGDSFGGYCIVPLENTEEAGASAGDVVSLSSPSVSIPESLHDLLIAGKRDTSSDKLEGRLYVFDSNGACTGWSEPEYDRCNIRIVKDLEGNLYQINTNEGVLRLDETNEAIIPPGQITDFIEPRNNKAAVVYVGLQGTGENAIGRPILDAAFDTNFVYVVPVVIDPNDPNEEPYAVAAKLQLLESGNPPYQLIQIYDQIPTAGTNQYLNNLREIELDAEGNVYVVNTHRLNESDTIWKYGPDGTKLKALSLGNPTTVDYLPDPVGMYVSNTTGLVYLASGQYNPVDVTSTVIHGLSLGDLSLKRSINIDCMHNVVDITEEPATGTLWIVGFNMDSFPLPKFPKPTDPAFYSPCLASVAFDSNTAQAVSIEDPNTNDLALPLSIVWTKPVKCGGADINGDGTVTFADFAALSSAWLTEIGDTVWNPGCNISATADAFIDARDLAALIKHWLETDCF